MGNVLLSTAYFPPISWIREVLNADKVVIEAHETYPKQTYRNRCHVAGANRVLPLSIPVTKVHGKETVVKDIEICYTEDWQRLHRRSIEDAYTNSPFYLYYWDAFSLYFEKKYKFLLDLNMDILQTIFSILEHEVIIELTERYEHKPENIIDLRNSISPKLPIDKTEFPRYQQVFEEKYGFQSDLSILDLLFNEGPSSISYFE